MDVETSGGSPRPTCRETHRRYVVVVPTRYGPPWHEGVSNLARRLVQNLRDSGGDVVVLTTGSRSDGGAGEFGERVVRWGTGSSGLGRLAFWTRVTVFFLRARSSATSGFLFASLSKSTSARVRVLDGAIGGRLIVYVTGLATADPGTGPRELIRGRTAVISPFLNRWLPGAAVVGPFLPLGFDGPAAAPQFPRRGEPFRLLFLGAYEPGRGVEELLYAFHSARRAGRPLEITLAINGAAGGSASALEEWVRREGIEDGVTVKGVVDVAREYRRCHAVVIPRQSRVRMSFPVRLIEAAHWKRPIITTTACDMHRLVRPQGEAPDPGDTEGLARSLGDIAAGPEAYAAAVDDILKFRERYDPDASLRKITQILMNS